MTTRNWSTDSLQCPYCTYNLDCVDGPLCPECGSAPQLVFKKNSNNVAKLGSLTILAGIAEGGLVVGARRIVLVWFNNPTTPHVRYTFYLCVVLFVIGMFIIYQTMCDLKNGHYTVPKALIITTWAIGSFLVALLLSTP